MAGTISLYLRDDTLRKLDAEVARAAADDRAHGLTGPPVTNRSKFIERIIEDHLDTSTLPSKQDIRYHVASLSEQYGAAKVSLFGSYARGEANEDSDIDILLEKGDIKGLQVLDFQEDLARRLDRPVDDVTTAGASARFLAKIRQAEVVLYDASSTGQRPAWRHPSILRAS